MHVFPLQLQLPSPDIFCVYDWAVMVTHNVHIVSKPKNKCVLTSNSIQLLNG